jgi:hypothetical protein
MDKNKLALSKKKPNKNPFFSKKKVIRKQPLKVKRKRRYP